MDTKNALNTVAYGFYFSLGFYFSAGLLSLPKLNTVQSNNERLLRS